jgi:hypothetical protein
MLESIDGTFRCRDSDGRSVPLVVCGNASISSQFLLVKELLAKPQRIECRVAFQRRNRRPVMVASSSASRFLVYVGTMEEKGGRLRKDPPNKYDERSQFRPP